MLTASATVTNGARVDFLPPPYDGGGGFGSACDGADVSCCWECDLYEREMLALRGRTASANDGVGAAADVDADVSADVVSVDVRSVDVVVVIFLLR